MKVTVDDIMYMIEKYGCSEEWSECIAIGIMCEFNNKLEMPRADLESFREEVGIKDVKFIKPKKCAVP